MNRCVILLLISYYIAAAQPLKFDHIGLKEGLPQSTVSSIFQDAEGFLWLGTWDGLVRYDGYTFLTYRNIPNDTTSLTNNNIRNIVQDHSGYLWLTTQNGLNRFQPRSASVKQFFPDSSNPVAINSPFVYSVIQGMNGDIYFGTHKGFSIYDTTTGHFTNIVLPSINTSRGKTLTILGIYQESSEILWLGSFDGLIRYNLKNSSYSAYPYIDSKKNKIGANQPTRDNNGLYWCTAVSNQIVVFDPAKRIYLDVLYNGHHINSEDVLKPFHPATDGSMWIVAYERLIHIRSFHRSGNSSIIIDSLEEYHHDPADQSSLNATSLMSFHQDRSGVVWVGTSSGLNKAVPQRKEFHAYDEQFFARSGIGSNELVSFLRAGKDSLWIGTREGIFLLGKKNGSYVTLGRNFNIPKTTVLSLTRIPNGTMLVGTRDGFFVWNEQKKRFDRKHPYPSNENTLWRIFTFLYLDDALWIGTNDGLYRTTDPNYERFEQIQFDPTVHKFFQILRLVKTNVPNEILICTNNDGLYRYNAKTGRSEVPLKHLKNDSTSLSHSIIMDAVQVNDTLWAATYGGGLNRIITLPDGKISIRHFRESNGLINDNLYCIIPDREGNLWMSSNKGLTRFEPRTERFFNFTVHDGLPANEFNHNAFLADSGGKMLFGGIAGFVEFDPKAIGQNTVVPQIAISDFRIFEQPRNELLQNRTITLNYNENFLSFEFASLSYVAPLKNRYAYRMIGVNEQWTFTDVRRYASFTNLSPGEYFFQVKGTNNDGVWNEEGASVRIIIRPPWWGTVWFRIILVLLFIGVIAGSVWAISRRKYLRNIEELKKQQALMEERHRTRQQIARDLHDDVASTISSISLYSDMIQRKKSVKRSELSDAVKKISLLSSGAKQAMEEVVWSLSPKHDSLDHLVNRIGDTAVQWCGDHSIECHLAFCVIPPGMMIDDDVRKNVYLIFKEGMNNVVKHSQASAVELTARFEDEHFYLSINDNGIGIRTERDRTRTIGGNGLVNMRSRAESIGGELSVSSTKNTGTTISLKIKMTQLRH
ncbi:MAG: sensor histidine kinase [Bacteroidota bacterium]